MIWTVLASLAIAALLGHRLGAQHRSTGRFLPVAFLAGAVWGAQTYTALTTLSAREACGTGVFALMLAGVPAMLGLGIGLTQGIASLAGSFGRGTLTLGSVWPAAAHLTRLDLASDDPERSRPCSPTAPN
jgi:hypothetical protein